MTAVTRNRAQPGSRRPARRRLLLWVKVAVLAVVALIWIYPLVWTFAASLKSDSEIFSDGLNLLPSEWRWDNYARAWTDAGFSQYMLNSVIVTIASVAIVILRSATAGYVLARYKFRGRRLVLGVLLATMFVPPGLFIIPIVDLSDMLGLLNTKTGLILALSAGGNVAAVLLYMGFYSRIPRELEEAAVVDGAGFLRTFFSVMLPLSGPITATVAVVTFLGAWSNFFVPLVFTFSNPDERTLAVGMLAFRGTDSTDWTGLTAAATLSLLPVLLVFILLQRYFVEGIAGAVKS